MEHSKVQPTHLWCSKAPRDLAQQVLREYCQDIEPIWAGPAEEYLCMCYKCLDHYQEGKRILLEQEPNMNEILKFRESLRLRAWIGAYIEQRENDVPERDVALFQENSQGNAGGQLQQPIREILQHPKLLFDKDLNASFVKYVESESSADAQPSYAAPITATQMPGILLLLIHPNQMVRKWASRMLRREPAITRENYDDEVGDIITCMLSPVEFGLFNTLDFEMWDATGSDMLPRNLVCIDDQQAYWKGILQVLSCLDKDATRTRLMGKKGHHDIADALVNVIMESKQTKASEDSWETSVFWSALECLEVLLSKLESSLWDYISLTPDQILKDIIFHPVFEIAISGQQQHINISRSQHQCVKIVAECLQKGLELDPTNQDYTEFLQRMDAHRYSSICGNRCHSRERRPSGNQHPLEGMEQEDIERFIRGILGIVDLEADISITTQVPSVSVQQHGEEDFQSDGISTNIRQKGIQACIIEGESVSVKSDTNEVPMETTPAVCDRESPDLFMNTQPFEENAIDDEDEIAGAISPSDHNVDSPDDVMCTQEFEPHSDHVDAEFQDDVMGTLEFEPHSDLEGDGIGTQEFEPHSGLEEDEFQDDGMGTQEFEPHTGLKEDEFQDDGMGTQAFEPHTGLEEDEFQDDVMGTQEFEPQSDVGDVKLQDDGTSISSPPPYSEPVKIKPVKLSKKKVLEFRLKLSKFKEKASSGSSNKASSESNNDKPSNTTERESSSKEDEDKLKTEKQGKLKDNVEDSAGNDNSIHTIEEHKEKDQASHGSSSDVEENEPQLKAEENPDGESFSSSDNQFGPSAAKRDCSYSIQLSKRKIAEFLSKISKLKDTKSNGSGNDKPSNTTESDLLSQEDEDPKEEHEVSHGRPKTEENPDVKPYDPFPDVISDETRQRLTPPLFIIDDDDNDDVILENSSDLIAEDVFSQLDPDMIVISSDDDDEFNAEDSDAALQSDFPFIKAEPASEDKVWRAASDCNSEERIVKTEKFGDTVVPFIKTEPVWKAEEVQRAAGDQRIVKTEIMVDAVVTFIKVEPTWEAEEVQSAAGDCNTEEQIVETEKLVDTVPAEPAWEAEEVQRAAGDRNSEDEEMDVNSDQDADDTNQEPDDTLPQGEADDDNTNYSLSKKSKPSTSGQRITPSDRIQANRQMAQQQSDKPKAKSPVKSYVNRFTSRQGALIATMKGKDGASSQPSKQSSEQRDSAQVNPADGSLSVRVDGGTNLSSNKLAEQLDSVEINPPEGRPSLEVVTSRKGASEGDGHPAERSDGFKSAGNAQIATTSTATISTEAPRDRRENEPAVFDQNRPHSLVGRRVSFQAAEVTPSNKFNTDHFLKWVLSWKCDWLRHGRESSDVSGILHQCPYYQLKDVPKEFKSMDCYFEVFIPHLLVETWAKLRKQYHETSNPKMECIMYRMPRQDAIHSGLIKACQVRVLIPRNKYDAKLNLCEEDFVIISPHPYVNSACRSVFGIVLQVSREKIDSSREAPRKYREVTLLTDLNFQGDDQQQFNLQVIGSLATATRQFSAVMSLHRSTLARDILRFRRMDVFCHDNFRRQRIESETPCTSTEVTDAAVKALSQPAALPRIFLLQGPPGTGKTYTIINTVVKMLQMRDTQPDNSHPKILLCAPSNTAVDVVVRNLVKALIKTDRQGTARPEGKKTHQNAGQYSVIRLGRKDVHAKVKPFCLDNVVEWEMRKKMDAVDRHIKELGRQIRYPKDNMDKLKLDGMEDQCHQLHEEIDKLCNQLRALEDKEPETQNRIRQEVLMKADVICCTLNSSGSQMFQSHIYEMDNNRLRQLIHFSCVIVDEATQCTEPDCLIPLQYGASKLLLVGDPQQLPATVISKEAARKKYSQSLFERHYRYFKLNQEIIPHNPVWMLKEQFRMHTEICHFPSQRFYEGHLETNRDVARQRFFLNPYLVFDVADGREHSYQHGAFDNKEEANFLMELCDYIRIELQRRHQQPITLNIGIITPYRKQKHLLIDKFHGWKDVEIGRVDAEIATVDLEISTVDSFQGREKDIILLSCVRTKGIGFAEDLHRMNVALTRARYALYVIGNVESLYTDCNWKALIDDAHQRKLIKKARRGNYSSVVNYCKKRKPNVSSNKGSSSRPENNIHVTPIQPDEGHNITPPPKPAVGTSRPRNTSRENLNNTVPVKSNQGTRKPSHGQEKSVGVARKRTSNPPSGSKESSSSATKEKRPNTARWSATTRPRKQSGFTIKSSTKNKEKHTKGGKPGEVSRSSHAERKSLSKRSGSTIKRYTNIKKRKALYEKHHKGRKSGEVSRSSHAEKEGPSGYKDRKYSSFKEKSGKYEKKHPRNQNVNKTGGNQTKMMPSKELNKTSNPSIQLARKADSVQVQRKLSLGADDLQRHKPGKLLPKSRSTESDFERSTQKKKDGNGRSNTVSSLAKTDGHHRITSAAKKDLKATSHCAVPEQADDNDDDEPLSQNSHLLQVIQKLKRRNSNQPLIKMLESDTKQRQRSTVDDQPKQDGNNKGMFEQEHIEQGGIPTEALDSVQNSSLLNTGGDAGSEPECAVKHKTKSHKDSELTCSESGNNRKVPEPEKPSCGVPRQKPPLQNTSVPSSCIMYYQTIPNANIRIAHKRKIHSNQPSDDDDELLRKKNLQQEHPSGQPSTSSYSNNEQSTMRLPSGAGEPVNIQVNQPHHAQAVNANQSANQGGVTPDMTHGQQTVNYQSSYGSGQQRPPHLQAQTAQLAGQFILTKTDPKGLPALGMLQKGGITQQQLQDAQVISQGPKGLPALGMLQKGGITQQQLQDAQVISQGPKLGTGKVRQHLQRGAIDTNLLWALPQPQQVPLQAAHLISSKEELQGGKEAKAIKQVQTAGIQHLSRPFITAQSQQIPVQLQGHLQPQTPSSLQQPSKVTTQPQTTQKPIALPTISPSLQQGQARLIQLRKIICKPQPLPSSKSPASTLVTTPILQAFSISTPSSNVCTIGSTMFAQLQTAPNQPGTVHMPATQTGKPPPFVPVAGQKIVPATKGFVTPVSLTSATLGQQLAQARPQVIGSLATLTQQLTQARSRVTCQSQTPIKTQTSPQEFNISQQLKQAGIRQPLPTGTQLHMTPTSKGLQLQSIQIFTCSSTSTSTLASPRMTVAQLQAQAKIAPRISSSQQRTMMSPLQGRITTVDRRGVLSNAHVIPGNIIQVQGALPQTSMIPAGQITSQSTGAQALPIQATTIPTNLMSSQANAGTGQVGVDLQKSNMTGAAGQINNIVMQQQPWGTAVVQQAMQARLVHQQSGGQGNVATTSAAPTYPGSQYFTTGKYK